MPRYIKRKVTAPIGLSKARKFADVEKACLTDDERIHEDETFFHTPTVFDHEPVPTGILDEDGNEFMRMPERIGFWWKD
jgi:hypothetical protein